MLMLSPGEMKTQWIWSKANLGTDGQSVRHGVTMTPEMF